jgi:hypothetical protein
MGAGAAMRRLPNITDIQYIPPRRRQLLPCRAARGGHPEVQRWAPEHGCPARPVYPPAPRPLHAMCETSCLCFLHSDVSSSSFVVTLHCNGSIMVQHIKYKTLYHPTSTPISLLLWWERSIALFFRLRPRGRRRLRLRPAQYSSALLRCSSTK